MVKRIICVVLCVLFLVSTLGAVNLQRTYTSRDWEYQLTDMLAREAGVVGTPGISPFPASGLLIVLERIDPLSLSSESREDLEALKAVLSGDNEAVVFESGSMAVEADAAVNFRADIADYSQFDWSNQWTDGRGEYVQDRHNETIVPFRYQTPFLSVLMRVYFGSWFQLEGGIAVSNNNHHLYESSLGWVINKYNGELLTLGMPDQFPSSLQFDFPWRAGISAGNEYFNFIIGRYPHSYGSGVTGNLIIGDNFTYQEIAQLTFMNNYFMYGLSVTNFDQQIPASMEGLSNALATDTSFSQREFSGDQQYRIVHRFDVNVLDRVRFTFDLSTLYNTDNGFDLRFFYPFFIHHNLSNYTNEPGMSYYDEANNIMGFSIEGALPFGLSASFSFVLDQASTYTEKQNTVPSAYGMLANIKHTARIPSGRFNSYLEFVLTNPYLYLNGKYYDGENPVYEYNLDYIVGYYSMNLSDVGYSGYISGPDSIVLSLGTEFIADAGYKVGGSLSYRLRGENGYRVASAKMADGDHNHTYIDMSHAVFNEGDSARVPSGDWNKVEHMIKAAVFASYTFDVTNIEVYAGAAFHLYYNYDGNPEADGVFKPQAMIGVKWTGLDNSWWGK